MRIVPPPSKRGLCPKEINRLGATGVQFEAWDSQNTGYHSRINEQELLFHRFCNKDGLFLWLQPKIHENSRLHLRIRENLHVFCDEDQNLWNFAYFLRWRPFFLVFTPDFVEFRVEHLFLLVHTLEFEEIKFSCTPKICLCLPSHTILAPGLLCSVDDIFAVFETNKSCLKFLGILNSQHKTKKFTAEHDSELMWFLDVQIKITENGCDSWTWRKTTHTGLLLNFDTYAPWNGNLA